MMPTPKTIFKNLSQIDHYKDEKKWFCTGVVFSPETENDHFQGCPPYIHLCKVDGNGEADDDVYFKIPYIVAYYAKTHPAYTMRGMERRFEAGKRAMKEEIKNLLGIKD